MEVTLLDNYVIVRRTSDNATICAAIIGPDNQLHNLEFTRAAHRTSNRTRQAAMAALTRAGYR